MGKTKQRIAKRAEWHNWNGGVFPEELFEQLSEGRAPAFCLDCDVWFAYQWGHTGHVKHPGCGGDCTFAY